MTTRYDPAGIESEFEPGSGGRVLRNLLGIKRVRDINLAESQALGLAQARAVETISESHCFNAADIRRLHRLWLEPLYAWAGEYRNVNMGKGGFQFAASAQIPRLMQQFEREVLARHTPCKAGSNEEIVAALAHVHAELILIHPFREGNGRMARLLAMLMALQAGLPPLDFSPMEGRGKRIYIAAIHAALGRNYQPLERLFLRIIERTWKTASSSNR